MRNEIEFLGYQASQYKVSAMLRQDDPIVDPEWIASASQISLARAVAVNHIYGLWRDDETNIPADARIDWAQVLATLKKVALLEELLREKAESDALFLDEAMSGMAFMRRMIDGWERQHPDPEDGEFDDEAEDALVFNSKMEGAFFFLDGIKLRQLRDRLRKGRKQSDLRVLQTVVDSDDVLYEDDDQDETNKDATTTDEGTEELKRKLKVFQMESQQAKNQVESLQQQLKSVEQQLRLTQGSAAESSTAQNVMSSKNIAEALTALAAEDRAAVLAAMPETVELKGELQRCQIQLQHMSSSEDDAEALQRKLDQSNEESAELLIALKASEQTNIDSKKQVAKLEAKLEQMTQLQDEEKRTMEQEIEMLQQQMNKQKDNSKAAVQELDKVTAVSEALKDQSEQLREALGKAQDRLKEVEAEKTTLVKQLEDAKAATEAQKDRVKEAEKAKAKAETWLQRHQTAQGPELAAMSVEARTAAVSAMCPEDAAAALRAMTDENRAATLAAMSPVARAGAMAAMIPEESLVLLKQRKLDQSQDESAQLSKALKASEEANSDLRKTEDSRVGHDPFAGWDPHDAMSEI